VDRPVALQGGLGGVTSPDQIIGRTGIEALGFTAGGIHHHGPAAGRSLITLPAQGATIKAPILEGRAAARATLALRTTHGTALAAAAAAAGSIKAGTLETTLTATGGVEPALAALRTSTSLGPAASE
jgi:hypothetical protein